MALWRTERKMNQGKSSFALWRRVEGRDFRARQFHLFTRIPGYLFFVGVFCWLWLLFVVLFVCLCDPRYLGFLQLLHLLLTSKRSSGQQGHVLDRLQRKKNYAVQSSSLRSECLNEHWLSPYCRFHHETQCEPFRAGFCF